MRGTCLKDCPDRESQLVSWDCDRFGDQHQINQVLHSGTCYSTPSVPPRVGVQLFSYVLNYRYGRNLDRRYVRKIEKIRTSEEFFMAEQRVTEADVNSYVIEQPASQFAAYVEPDCGSFFSLIAPFHIHQRKDEAILQIIGGRRKKVALGRLGIILSLYIQIHGRSRPLLEAKVKRECAL